MEQQTRLANVIDSAGADASYDRCVKAILANRSILTWILKCCVEEFRDFDLATISSCIQGTPEVAVRAVHQNEENNENPDDSKKVNEKLDGNEEIIGENTEASSVSETKVTYDLRFGVSVPNTDKTVEMIINVEAQKRRTGYDIRSRAIYYMSRLISSQYGTVFKHSEYNKIKKVYSIWFCVDVPYYMKNTITGLRLNEDAIYGKPPFNPEAVDLMRGIVVRLGKPNDETENKIIKMMNTLLSSTVSAEEKKRMLSDIYHIAMTEELESEVSEMCNLSQSVREEGRTEEKIKLAKKLLARGKMTDDEIAEDTELTLAEVLKLKPVVTA